MSFAEQMQANAEATGMKKVQGKAPSGADQGSVKVDSTEMAGLMAANKVSTPQLNASTPQRVITRGAPAIGTPFDTGPVPTWSYSGLVNHERCPHFTRMNKVDKIAQESGEAAARGSRLHDACEDWVRDKIDALPKDGKTKFELLKHDFDCLKDDFKLGKVTLEEEWGCRTDWSPCGWDDAELWGKGKLDAFVMEDDTSCRIIDYKSGRKFGNEMKHKDQGVTYALMAFHRYPELEHFQIEFWYIDQGVKMVFSYGRAHLNIFLPLYHERAFQMTTDELFMPTPSVHNCVYCSYGCNTNKAGTKQYGNGECDYDFYKDREEI